MKLNSKKYKNNYKLIHNNKFNKLSKRKLIKIILFIIINK